MGHDPIKYALWIGGLGLAITLFCGVYIAWINGGSRNLGLGLGTLVGACVIFLLQIVFELRGSTTSSDFVVEFVVDFQERSVRSPRAYNSSIAVAARYRNLPIEIEASNTIVAATPPLTRDDAPRITRDLGIISIISYLFYEQPDWQLDTKSYKTSIGTMTQQVRLSPPKVRAAGNMFAGVQFAMMGDKASLCLPPHTVLDVTQNSVAIRSFVCSVLFTLQEPFSSMTSIDPLRVSP